MSPADGKTPEEVRRDIEATRDQLADTAAALAAKTDVKERARERVDELKDDVRSRVTEVKETVAGKAHEVRDAAAPGSDGAGENLGAKAASAGHAAGEQVRAHPLPSAVIAAALLGFALGYLLARR